MKKYIFTCISFCLVSLYASYAQQLEDTTKMSVVCIYGNYFNDGSKKEVIDSFALSNYYSSSLQNLLQQSTSLTIKSYGNAGSSASISIRSAGSSRTQVSWEGFPLNSLSMGNNDCSTIPIAGFNQISINYNASATYFGSGAVGGAVELQNIPKWKNYTKISGTYSESSFSTNSYTCNFSKGTKNIDYSGSILYNESNGNFPYKDYAGKQLYRENASYSNYGIFQNLHILLTPQYLLQAGIWYQVKQNEIPAIMGAKPFFNETQTDSSFKTFISLKRFFKKSYLTYKTAFFDDFQFYSKTSIYQNSTATKDNIHNRRNFHVLQYKHNISSKITGLLEIQTAINTADITDYENTKTEFSNAYIGAVQYKTKKYQSNFSIRKEFNTQYKIPIIFNLGNLFIIQQDKLLVRVTAGNKYRTPTFNDLYWKSWGNPDLIPEHGFSFESGGTYTFFKTSKQIITTDLSYYNTTIRDMILWNQQGAIWHPFNLAEAKIQGYEIAFSQNYSFQKFQIRNNVNTNIITSYISKIYKGSNTEAALGHSLYYEPKYSIFASTSIFYKNFRAFVSGNFYSLRYYSITNTLPAYALCNSGISYTHTNKNISSLFSFSCNNITNTSYELIRSYPMPGRYFEFSIQLTLKK